MRGRKPHSFRYEIPNSHGTELRNERLAVLYEGAHVGRIAEVRRSRAGVDEAAGRKRLGLDAQRAAIDDFVASREADVIDRFTEVESGKKATQVNCRCNRRVLGCLDHYSLHQVNVGPRGSFSESQLTAIWRITWSTV